MAKPKIAARFVCGMAHLRRELPVSAAYATPHRRSTLTIRSGPVCGLRWSPPDSRNRRSSSRGVFDEGSLRCRWRSGRLLLRHAVQRAQPEDQIAAGNADRFAPGKELGDRVERDAVV